MLHISELHSTKTKKNKNQTKHFPVNTSSLCPSGEALQCYTCMGSNSDDCNRQGSKSCPSYSDACAVVVGHDSESSSDSLGAFLSLAFFLPERYIKLCLYLRVCVCVLSGRLAAVWRHISVSRGSEAFKEMRSFATSSQSISLIRTPCVPGTETIPLHKMNSVYWFHPGQARVLHEIFLFCYQQLGLHLVWVRGRSCFGSCCHKHCRKMSRTSWQKYQVLLKHDFKLSRLLIRNILFFSIGHPRSSICVWRLLNRYNQLPLSARLSGGVMKSCSYKSFCSQATSQGYRAPGVKVHCCYSDDCNVTSFACRLPGLSSLLLFLPLLFHCLFKLSYYWTSSCQQGSIRNTNAKKKPLPNVTLHDGLP